MTCTTFLHDSELNVPTSNEEINKILEMVRTETEEDWQVIQRRRIITRRLPFVKRKTVMYYEVYKFVGGMGPWQIINFYRDNSASSINFGISAEMLLAYMYGILGGLDASERKKCKKT